MNKSMLGSNQLSNDFRSKLKVDDSILKGPFELEDNLTHIETEDAKIDQNFNATFNHLKIDQINEQDELDVEANSLNISAIQGPDRGELKNAGR